MSDASKFDTKEFRDKRARERVEELSHALAVAINGISSHLELFKFECSENGWNDEVAFDIEEGITKLGCGLATLYTWYDDENDTEDDDSKNDC